MELGKGPQSLERFGVAPQRLVHEAALEADAAQRPPQPCPHRARVEKPRQGLVRTARETVADRDRAFILHATRSSQQAPAVWAIDTQAWISTLRDGIAASLPLRLEPPSLVARKRRTVGGADRGHDGRYACGVEPDAATIASMPHAATVRALRRYPEF